jgi:hypothetical protein
MIVLPTSQRNGSLLFGKEYPGAIGPHSPVFSPRETASKFEFCRLRIGEIRSLGFMAPNEEIVSKL